jgi:tetratricopeptide (TPR) repeat protein
MSDEDLGKLSEAGWEHISAGRFTEAESAFREVLTRTDPQNTQRLWHLFGVLGDVLNSLHRTDEAAEMMRRALSQAERLGTSRTEFHYSRYRLGNHALNFGSPSDALAELDPIPEGAGHIQCLMHMVAARAL